MGVEELEGGSAKRGFFKSSRNFSLLEPPARVRCFWGRILFGLGFRRAIARLRFSPVNRQETPPRPPLIFRTADRLLVAATAQPPLLYISLRNPAPSLPL
jgi:hypothetical protein